MHTPATVYLQISKDNNKAPRRPDGFLGAFVYFSDFILPNNHIILIVNRKESIETIELTLDKTKPDNEQTQAKTGEVGGHTISMVRLQMGMCKGKTVV